MYNPFSLQGKTIFVTGASSGIGKAIAIECSKMGATLIITGRNKERLNDTFQLLEGNGHSLFCGDLCDDEFLNYLLAEISLIDGLVNSAGIVKQLPFKYTSREKLNDLFGINFEVPTLLTHGLIKNKKIKKGGSIIFISSIAGVITSEVSLSLYSATKGAINGLAKGIALEVVNLGIRVNTIIPAMVETNIMHEGLIPQEQMDIDVKHYPLKRYGKPEEVAYAAIYLLSDASTWVTGSNMLLDGGLTLR